MQFSPAVRMQLVTATNRTMNNESDLSVAYEVHSAVEQLVQRIELEERVDGLVKRNEELSAQLEELDMASARYDALDTKVDALKKVNEKLVERAREQ